MKINTQIGVMQTQATECLEPPEAGRDQGRFSPKAFKGEQGTANILISDFQAKRRDGINIYCFKPLSWWRFATTALGHDHRQFVMKMQHLKGKHCAP